MEPAQHDLPKGGHCPQCRMPMEGVTAVSGSVNPPAPGDITMCLYCGALLRFTETISLRLAEQRDIDELGERSRQLLSLAGIVAKKFQAQRYEKQLQLMRARLDEWRLLNPEREVKIQFNFPRDVGVICPIEEAIAKHFVSLDDGGRELIAALCATDEPSPTVVMVKIALGWTHGDTWVESPVNRLKQP